MPYKALIIEIFLTHAQKYAGPGGEPSEIVELFAFLISGKSCFVI